MKKRTVLLAGLALLAVGISGAALAGCAGYRFEEYSFNYGGESKEDWRKLEFPDQNIKMDGLISEEEYGRKHLSFSDVNDVNMKVYGHLGEEGVFFGFVSDDKQVNYNTKNDVFNNTSVEIQVAPQGTEKLNSNVVQLRLGANGTPDQWIGFPADDMKYGYTKKYIPSMGVVHIDGELNKGAEGYSVELYLPYASIGLTEKPESVVCAPSFNTMPDPYSSTRATWTMMLGCDLGQPATWYVVDETGMTSHTAGFVEKGTGVIQEKGFNEFYYFDTAPHANYYLKTTLNVKTTMNPFLNNDNFPKFGLVNKSEHALQMFYIDAANKNGTNFGTVRAIQSTASGTDWQWNNNASTSLEGHWGNTYIGNYRDKELETIYYEGNLYFVLDGVLVKTVKNFSPETEGAVPGLVCFNTKATFNHNEFVTEKDKVKAEVEKFTAKDVKIDGDLSDWTDEDINRHAKTVADDENGNSMTVRAFRGTDGLYIAYEVNHIVSITPSKWDEGWWKNTNIEFYVNGSGKNNRYALTSFGNGGYMDGVMNVTRKPDRTYFTAAEIFVPFESLKRDGYSMSEPLEVGFAFKSANGSEDSYLGGKTLWTIAGAPSTDRLSVLEKGIGEEFTLSYAGGSDITGTAPASVKVYAGDTVALAQNPFAKENFTFAGWTDGTNGYGAGDSFVMPAEDIEIAPKWAAENASATYGVTYEKGADGVEGELPADGNQYKQGDLITLADGTITREGYRFFGWSDGSKTYAAGSRIFMEEQAITLTAVWAREYALGYAAGGDKVEGDLPAEKHLIAGETVVVSPAVITREGYDFFGWSDGRNVYYAEDSFVMPEEAITLTAVWREKIKLDGDLKDWVALGTETVGAHSINKNDERQATWYGTLRDDGLYLAVEIYHNRLGSGQRDWWKNLNFEIHVGPGSQQFFAYVSKIEGDKYIVGKSSNNISAAYAHGAGTEKKTAHRSVFEVFLPDRLISGMKEEDGSLRVGVSIKTDDNREAITGGTYNYADGDAWYAPYGVLADRYEHFAYVTADGMFLKNMYEQPDKQFGVSSAVAETGITVDGDVSEWGTAANKTIGVTGEDLYAGKSVTFYGKMTQSGLYLAVKADHSMFTTGKNDWWTNTNFEFRIGEVFGGSGEGNLRSKQYYVYAKSNTEFAASSDAIRVAGKTETLGNGKYHTELELFIPAADLVQYDYMVQYGMMHVGVAWKTDGDLINNNEFLDGSDTAAWWRPKGTHIEYKPACVNGNGIYTAKEYEELA